MKLPLLVFVFCLLTTPIFAETFYMSSAGGTQTCAGGARSTQTLSYFNTSTNWASPKVSGKVGPGDTLYVCGTFTFSAGGTGLFAQGSGTSGNPITIRFDTGAVMQAPYFLNGGSGLGGAINFNSNSYLILDGGTACGFTPATLTTTACNGLIQNTDNGTTLTRNASVLVEVGTGTNNEVKNMYLLNAYQRSGTSYDGPTFDDTEVTSIEAELTANNVLLDHNVINMGGWCVKAGNGNLVTFNNNDVGNCEHDITTAATTILFHDNHLHDWGVWQDAGNDYHHDGLHCFAGPLGNTQTAYLYNNLFDGSTGPASTGMNQYIFMEGAGSITSCMIAGGTIYEFNNIFNGSTQAAFPALGGPIGNSIAITSYSITGNIATFTAPNNLTVGETGTLSLFGTSTFFNGQMITVLSSGLSSTQFEANFVHSNVSTVSESGHFDNSSTGDNGDLYVNNTGLGGTVSVQPLAEEVVDVSNAVVENNAIGGTGFLVTDQQHVSYSAFDYNAYQDCTGFNCWFASGADTSNFMLWQANNCTGSANTCDQHGIANISSSTYFNLDSNFKPQSGSPLINAGVNLTSLCVGNLTQLCSDFAGNLRPTGSTAWDIGAYQHSSTSGVSLSTTSIAFGKISIGSTSGVHKVTLTNVGGTALTITGTPSLGGTDPGDFAIMAETCVSRSPIAPGGTCSVSLTFTPTVTGLRTATLYIYDTDPTSPQTVSLTGTGK